MKNDAHENVSTAMKKTILGFFVYKTSILAKLMIFLAKSVLEHEQGKWKKAGNRLKTKVTKLLAIRLWLELMDIHHANILNVKTIKLPLVNLKFQYCWIDYSRCCI